MFERETFYGVRNDTLLLNTPREMKIKSAGDEMRNFKRVKFNNNNIDNSNNSGTNTSSMHENRRRPTQHGSYGEKAKLCAKEKYENKFKL